MFTLVRATTTHGYYSIPCTQQVADLGVCGFMFSVCQIRWNVTHFDIFSLPPRSILRSHLAHQSRDRILWDSSMEGRGPGHWRTSQIEIPGQAMCFNQSTCHFIRLATCLFLLGWFQHVVHSNQYLQRRDTPLSLGVIWVTDNNKVKRLAETIRLFYFCPWHTASPNSVMDDVHNLFCPNMLTCIACLSCWQSWVIPPHFTCMCLHLHQETIVPSKQF